MNVAAVFSIKNVIVNIKMYFRVWLPVSKFIVHPQFSFVQDCCSQGDIALLKLSDPVSFVLY